MGAFRKCLYTWWWPRSSKPLGPALTAGPVGSIPMHFRHSLGRFFAPFRVALFITNG